MKKLEMIRSILDSKKQTFEGKYAIPASWISFDYKKYGKSSVKSGEIEVNPYDFYLACIDNILNANVVKRARDNVMDNLIYSIFPRFFTAWPHYSPDKVCNGTLLKTLALLPMLKRMNISVLYLLPVLSISNHYKKGELGSPYSIRDFYKIDTGLHDPLLGTYTEEMLDAEFQALVEACHVLGIKVVVDFAFRTAARDNILISEHPDWFYWIKREFADDFKTPVIGDGKKYYPTNSHTIKMLYESPELTSYLSKFTLSPDKIDPTKWAEVKAAGTLNIDKRIEETFGITTVPGFSDVINDRQPAWTDVTYLRYYFDNPSDVAKYLPENQPPYIMQDGASLAHDHGNEKNEELWKYIVNILPFFKKKFGIDGARIDMAHALPVELNKEIISEIKRVAPDFILWSEELDPSKGEQAKSGGFDFISGFTYADYKKAGKREFNKAIISNLLQSALPVVSSLETPDTPRSALIHKNFDALKQLVAINFFVPNSIPMINSGQELLEIQPMNLGLDNDERGRFVLPETDPMYGKLAFFDCCCLHWEKMSEEMVRLIRDMSQIREEYISLISDGEFVRHDELWLNKKLSVFHYRNGEGINFIVAANRSNEESAILDVFELLQCSECGKFNFVYDSHSSCKTNIESAGRLMLSPLETVIIAIE